MRLINWWRSLTHSSEQAVLETKQHNVITLDQYRDKAELSANDNLIMITFPAGSAFLISHC